MMSRDELGKALIELTKNEIEQHGDIPNQEILDPVFESQFGELVKGLSLFDLNVFIRRNEVITEAAQRKQIDNIVRLTKAFNVYLCAKRDEKEKKTQDFLAKKLEQMAVA